MAAFNFPFSTRGQVGVSSDMQKENVRTFLADGVTTVAATRIGFGQPVTRSTNGPKTAKAYTAGDPIIGITLFSGDIDDLAGYPQGENLPVLNEGQVWVYAAGDCTAGSQVEFVAATGGFQDADGGDELPVEQFTFESDATVGEAVRLQVSTRIS